MGLGINAVRSVAQQVTSGAGAVSQLQNFGQELKQIDQVAQAMLSKLQDGFEQPKAKATPPPVSSAQQQPAKKKKKKHHGLFGAIGGLLKKALPMVSKIAGFIPGLSAIAKPLEMVTSLVSNGN